MLYKCELVIPFDWQSWDGRETLTDTAERLAEIGPIDAVKLITVCIRAVRFVDGMLADEFQSGRMTVLLRCLLRFPDEKR